jgi:ketosteroid isomerase-like protein
VTDRRNEQLVQALAEALSAGDLGRTRVLFHQDATWAVMGGVPDAGRPQAAELFLANFLDRSNRLFADGRVQVQVRRIFSQDGNTAAENTASGKLKDGKSYENEQLWIIEERDGKILAVREYMSGNHISAL